MLLGIVKSHSIPILASFPQVHHFPISLWADIGPSMWSGGNSE